ncbi:MAG: TetR/AcrR family transcriptional regulator [Solirubrobacterales bacterium]
MAVKRQPRQRGRPRASEHEQEDTRRSLLDAAARLIAERGYHAMTVNEVIARAGLSKGTFYWYFNSKDDLLFAVLEEHIDRPLYELIELLKTAPPHHDMAPQASRRLLELLKRRHETILLEHEYQLLAIREPRLRARYVKRQAALRAALAAGLDARAQQLGAPPFSTPTSDVAIAYLALGSGLAVERMLDPDTVPENLLGDTVALIYQGLVARAERDLAGKPTTAKQRPARASRPGNRSHRR